MAWRFNPPPGWPTPPPGWAPPPGWTPDPSWPPAPDGWEFWAPDAGSSAALPPRRSRVGPVLAIIAVVLLVLLAVVALVVWSVARTIGDNVDVGSASKRLETQTEASTVRVDNECGQISVREGAGGVVRTDARITRFWRTPTVTSRDDGDTARVEVRCPPFSGTVRLAVEVPPGVEVQARSSAGGVQVDGLTGPLDLQSSAGSVQGQNLQSDQVVAQSSAGSVTLQWASDADPQQVDASSSAGSVTVQLPDRAGTAYAVDASSSAGSTTVQVRTDPESTRTVRAQSSAGSVTVGYR